jgi:hypothetical protein
VCDGEALSASAVSVAATRQRAWSSGCSESEFTYFTVTLGCEALGGSGDGNEPLALVIVIAGAVSGASLDRLAA